MDTIDLNVSNARGYWDHQSDIHNHVSGQNSTNRFCCVVDRLRPYNPLDAIYSISVFHHSTPSWLIIARLPPIMTVRLAGRWNKIELGRQLKNGPN